MRFPRKGIFLAIIFAVLFIATWYTTSYFLSLRTLVVEYKNTTYVAIYDGNELNEGTNPSPIKENIASGQEIKLRKGLYTVYYKGVEGYEDRYIEFELNENGQKFIVDPNYNEDKLTKDLEHQLPLIKKSLMTAYKNLGSSYKIERGVLYSKGEWYGTTLIYKGKDSANRDTLRVILNKNDKGQWVVKTNPPDIVLSKRVFKDIPEEILKAVNALPVPSLEDHGTGAILDDRFF